MVSKLLASEQAKQSANILYKGCRGSSFQDIYQYLAPELDGFTALATIKNFSSIYIEVFMPVTVSKPAHRTKPRIHKNADKLDNTAVC